MLGRTYVRTVIGVALFKKLLRCLVREMGWQCEARHSGKLEGDLIEGGFRARLDDPLGVEGKCPHRAEDAATCCGGNRICCHLSELGFDDCWKDLQPTEELREREAVAVKGCPAGFERDDDRQEGSV